MEPDEKKCPQCAGMVKSEAKICRYCSHSFESDAPSNPSSSPLPDKRKGRGKGCLIALAVMIALLVIASLVGGEQTAPPANIAASENADDSTNVSSGAPAAEERDSVPSVGLFGPQANAARSAKQYLDMTGFSRRGLIEQLSSDAGNGYSRADATAAVDSLTVDWNEQAARSAKQYLDMTGFPAAG